MINASKQNRYQNADLEFIARNYQVDSARHRSNLGRQNELESPEGFAYRGGVLSAQNLPAEWRG